MKRSVKIVAGTISGEHTSSTVSSVRCWGKPQDQKAGVRIAERGNRFAPVFPIAPRPTLYLRYFPAVSDQSCTAITGNDLLIQQDESGRGV